MAITPMFFSKLKIEVFYHSKTYRVQKSNTVLSCRPDQSESCLHFPLPIRKQDLALTTLSESCELRNSTVLHYTFYTTQGLVPSENRCTCHGPQICVLKLVNFNVKNLRKPYIT